MKDGDFVSAEVDLKEKHPAARQGVLKGNLLYGESGDVYHVKKVVSVVPDRSLWGSTLRFVQRWRKQHGE
jgi:hypothetical protein